MENKPKILVVGECFIDRYHIGSATQLSAEAPIPVVKVSKDPLRYLGGAGNVVENLKSLDVDVYSIFQSGHYPIKNRLMVGNTQVARWDTDDWCAEYKFRASISIPKVDALIISDYGKGMLKVDAWDKFFYKFTNTPIFIDTKTPYNYGPFVKTNKNKNIFFFPNAKEYANNSHYYTYLCDFNANIIVTKGSEGVEYINTKCALPALTNNVVSVNGAGDTFIAAFATSYVSHPEAPIKTHLLFASKAAAIVVAKPYTSTATLEEIENFETA